MQPTPTRGARTSDRRRQTSGTSADSMHTVRPTSRRTRSQQMMKTTVNPAMAQPTVGSAGRDEQLAAARRKVGSLEPRAEGRLTWDGPHLAGLARILGGTGWAVFALPVLARCLTMCP